LVSRLLDLVPGCLGSSLAESKGYEIAGKFELYKDLRGEFRFRLKTANDEIIASSEGYRSKFAAENGIRSVQTIAPRAIVVDKTI
jgi:uncharacterized protein